MSRATASCASARPATSRSATATPAAWATAASTSRPPTSPSRTAAPIPASSARASGRTATTSSGAAISATRVVAQRHHGRLHPGRRPARDHRYQAAGRSRHRRHQPQQQEGPEPPSCVCAAARSTPGGDAEVAHCNGDGVLEVLRRHGQRQVRPRTATCSRRKRNRRAGKAPRTVRHASAARNRDQTPPSGSTATLATPIMRSLRPRSSSLVRDVGNGRQRHLAERRHQALGLVDPRVEHVDRQHRGGGQHAGQEDADRASAAGGSAFPARRDIAAARSRRRSRPCSAAPCSRRPGRPLPCP